jgi:hypothetical protein
MADSSRYLQVCTQLVDGMCQSFEWVPFPVDSWLSVENALLIVGASAGVWAIAWGWPMLRRAL